MSRIAGIFKSLVSLVVVFLFAALLHSQDFSFGAVADIQYADKGDRFSRDFRDSLGKLDKAVSYFNTQDLAFVVQLGDMVDGQSDKDKNLEDYRKVLDIFNAIKAPKYHVAGNHCMTLGTSTLLQSFGTERLYYDFTVPQAPGWRFIVLDGNDGGTWRMGEGQLSWLSGKLKETVSNKERVICFCHFPLLNEIALTHRLHEPEDVLKVIDESHVDVIAWISGHHHKGGYALRNGVHHVSVKGMVEAKDNSYAVFKFHDGELVETGFGDEPSRTLKLQDAIPH